MSIIYHITSHQSAEAARKSGKYLADSLASQGFIHFSRVHQLLGVAKAFYAGQQDLVILVVDTSRLKSELKYEAADHLMAAANTAAPSPDQLFPHLYGPLNFDAVVKIVNLPLLANGLFELPTL